VEKPDLRRLMWLAGWVGATESEQRHGECKQHRRRQWRWHRTDQKPESMDTVMERDSDSDNGDDDDW